MTSPFAPLTSSCPSQVRQAIFNMIQSQAGTVSHLPSDARWLDLFAGTGSVGLEALSRGVREAHFVEMDPWVTKNVLGKNITTCGFNRKVSVQGGQEGGGRGRCGAGRACEDGPTLES